MTKKPIKRHLKRMANKPQKTERIIEETLDKKAEEEYYAYGVHVIEDRAIYGKIDGLKPVTRRALWATFNLGLRSNAPRDKSAKVVGETMGNYHPHGDSSIYGAIVTGANTPMKMFDGEGNWGTMTDTPAAMRYTNVRLSKYSDKVFFDPFYLKVMETVPNYDDSRQEPLNLPTLLPNALLNGNFGIAPGVNAATPVVRFKTLMPVIIDALKAGGKCTPEMCMKLDFTTTYGGKLRRVPTFKKDLKDFLRTGIGKFQFDSSYEAVKTHELRFNKFAPFSKLETVLGKIENIKGVVSTRDDSDKKDPYKIAFTVFISKSLGGSSLQSVIDKVVDAASANVRYSVQVTERKLDPNNPNGSKKLSPSTLPKLVEDWIAHRIVLEKKACKYWIVQREKEIAYHKLMILAVDNRKFIIQALDKKLDDKQLAEYIAKGLKITVEQANQILDLKVRQLKKLEKDTLLGKIKALKKEIAGYDERIRKPKRYIAGQIVEFYKMFKEEAA